MSDSPGTYDIQFHFDPVCPFAWLTSRWVNEVAAQRDHSVDWQFISLRIVNEHVDYDAHFPPEYEHGHTAGLRMLRVAAAARAAHGRSIMGDLYTGLGGSVFDVDPPGDHDSWDSVIRAETDAALALTGKDVGTPIIQYDPPNGPAFFGPVISRVPKGDDAVRLWDAVLELAHWPGFSELKRSMRELPALRVMGLADDEVGEAEDWHQGSRRLKK